MIYFAYTCEEMRIFYQEGIIFRIIFIIVKYSALNLLYNPRREVSTYLEV